MKNKIYKKIEELNQTLDNLPKNIYSFEYIVWLNQKTKIKYKCLDFSKKNKEYYTKYMLGQIVFVKCGENIGSEYSGNHYAIVVKSDSALSATLNVVYLTSQAKTKQYKLNLTIAEYIMDSLKEEIHLLRDEYTFLSQNSTIKDLKNKQNSINQKILNLERKIINISDNLPRVQKTVYVNLRNIAVISKSRINDYDNKRLNNVKLPKPELRIIVNRVKNIWFSNI